MKIPSEEPTVGGMDRDKTKTFRRSRVRWIREENPDFTFLFDDYWKLLVRVNRDFFNFNVTYLPPIQFTEYYGSDNGEYKSHQDVFWITDTPRHRKVSVVTQLSPKSNYDGGEFVFDNLNEQPPQEVIQKQGSVIAFPSFVYHSLRPVTRGVRFSLVGWFEGPKFQ
jgi:PKHD-type hydroxylase